jgi:ferredoxin
MVAAAVVVVVAAGAAVVGAQLLFQDEPDVPARENDLRSGNIRQIAVVACAGPSATPALHRYQGLTDCRIVQSLYSGDRACADACLGYGTCRDLCPLGAISIGDDGLPRIAESCDGCGICVAECPVSVIRLVPADADYYISCSSRAAPASRASFCSAPCVACDVCRLEGGGAGFSVHDGMAKINYATQGNRSLAAKACPTKCISTLLKDDKKAFHDEDNRLEWSERKNGASDATT